MGSRISVSILSGSSSFPIEDLPSNTKIVALKRDIFQFTGIFINNQILKFMGRVLDDKHTLAECGIRTAAIIELEERAEDSRKIFIESTNGNNLMTLDYDPNDTILNIKNHFLRDLNISIERQKLYFTTVLLQNGEKLSKYKIEEGTKLILEVTQLNPYCFMVEMPNGRVLDLDYEEDLSIDNLKQTISCRAGDIEADRMRLYFKEEQLESRKSLSRCNVKVGDTLKLKLREGGEIIIFIDAPTVKQEMLNLTLQNTIGDVKFNIMKEAGVPLERQALYLEDKLLQNENTLLQAGIEDGSRIKLVLEGPIVMKIIVKFNFQDIKLEVEVESESTVLKLKEIIEEKNRVKVESQKLMFAGRLLENNKQLSFYGIQKGCVIFLIQQFDRKEMQIIIKTNNDIEYPVSVLPKTKISEIKQKISMKEHGAPDQYQLMFSGKILTDETTVSNYEIKNESILHMELMRDETVPTLPLRMRSRSYAIREDFRDSGPPSIIFDPAQDEANINAPGTFQAVPEPSRDSDRDPNPLPPPPPHNNPDGEYLMMNIGDNVATPPVKYEERDGDVPPPKSIPLRSLYSADRVPRPSPYISAPPNTYAPSPVNYRDRPFPRENSSDRSNPYNEDRAETVPELYSPRTDYQNVPPPNIPLYHSSRSETTSQPAPRVGDVLEESCKIVNTSLPPVTKIAVRVSILCGGEFTFKFSDRATIRDVKKEVHSERGCKPECQKIYYQDTLCEDTHTLAKVGIVEQSVLVVDLLHGWNVSIGQHRMVVRCYASSKISDIKKGIYQMEKIDTEKQRIFLDERELKDEQPLLEYQPGPNLKFTLGLDKNISIVFSSGKTFILSSSQKLNGLLIKQQIMRSFKVPIENQTLTYLGKEMKNELTLEAVKFREENHIAVDVDSERSRLITIFVRLSTGEQRIVKIPSLETVGKIKSLINDTNYTLIDDHDLMYKHSSLSDEDVLEYYGIRNYDEIHVFSNEFKVVNVTLLEGNTEPFCLRAFQSQESMLVQIRNQFRLPPEYSGLFFDKRGNFHIQAISPGDNLYLGYTDSILVSISLSSSRAIHILVSREGRVVDLKSRIEMKEKIPHDAQELSYGGMPMHDYERIGKFDMVHFAIINLGIRESGLNYITIYVTDEDNNSVHLNEVNRYGTVNKLPDRLVAIGYKEQRDELFVFKNSVILPDAPLCYYGIHSGCELRLISPSTPNCLYSIREEFRYRPTSDGRYREDSSRRKTEYKHRSYSCVHCARIECVCVFRPHSATFNATNPGPISQSTSGSKLYGNRTTQQSIYPNKNSAPIYDRIEEDVVLPYTDVTPGPGAYQQGSRTPAGQYDNHNTDYTRNDYS